MGHPSEKTGNEKKVLAETISDDAALEMLGYTQELKRSFTLPGMIGFSFSIVTSWTALGGVLIVGVSAGGPPVMIWSWVGICLATLTVAYSMAEMCSAYPVAGGQYSWVAILAPKRWARGFSYVCGWFMLIGILAMGATNNFIAANFILGMANLQNPDFVTERWHTVLVAYAIAFLAAASNIAIPHFLDKISKGVLIWNICSFIAVFVTILAMNDHKQPTSFVFGTFQNFTGFNPAYAAILGILQSAFGMCCYDAPAHMTEEIKNARKQAPRAMVMAVYIGAITGFLFLIALSFCIGDIDATASTPTGVPLIEIFYNSTGSVGTTCALTTLVAAIATFCANSLMTEGSRSIYAFARDRGLPFSSTFSKVSNKQIPVNAVLLTMVVQMALNAIYFGTYTGFSTVIAMSTEGFYLSYAMPLLARIIAHVSGKKHRLEGPYSLGRYGLTLNIVGFIFLTFCCITFNLPSFNPVDSENMNYTSAAIGVVMLISIITWITTGRKRFTGPDSGQLLAVVGSD